MWLEKESTGPKVYFECKVVETQSVVISGAYVELHDVRIDLNANVEIPVQKVGKEIILILILITKF